MLRRRVNAPDPDPKQGQDNAGTATMRSPGEKDVGLADNDASLSSPLHTSSSGPGIVDGAADEKMRIDKRSSWMVFAVASGTCAAFNGVFAKLTTTQLTTSIAATIAGSLGLGEGNRVVEFIIRALFFSLNLAFNALMWVLFTRALTLHTSTTRVSILNTSSNFLFTAILGLLIFTESLPPLWFVGAGMLVVGNVIIGRREEEGKGGKEGVEGEEGVGLMGTGDVEDGGKTSVEVAEEEDEEDEDDDDDDDPLLNLRACAG